MNPECRIETFYSDAGHFICRIYIFPARSWMIRKDIKNFINCESALSEIIAVIILLAIVVFMIAIIQKQSVPEWNKAVEMDHFNVVYDDFLKITSDFENSSQFQYTKSG